MKNDEKEYIYWPNRKAIISSQIDRIRKVTKIQLKPQVHLLYNDTQ